MLIAAPRTNHFVIQLLILSGTNNQCVKDRNRCSGQSRILWLWFLASHWLQLRNAVKPQNVNYFCLSSRFFLSYCNFMRLILESWRASSGCSRADWSLVLHYSKLDCWFPKVAHSFNLFNRLFFLFNSLTDQPDQSHFPLETRAARHSTPQGCIPLTTCPPPFRMEPWDRKKE